MVWKKHTFNQFPLIPLPPSNSLEINAAKWYLHWIFNTIPLALDKISCLSWIFRTHSQKLYPLHARYHVKCNLRKFIDKKRIFCGYNTFTLMPSTCAFQLLKTHRKKAFHFHAFLSYIHYKLHDDDDKKNRRWLWSIKSCFCTQFESHTEKKDECRTNPQREFPWNPSNLLSTVSFISLTHTWLK